MPEATGRPILVEIYGPAPEGREPDLLEEIQSDWFFAVGDAIVLQGDRFAEVTEARRIFSVPTSTWSQVVHTKDALQIPESGDATHARLSRH